MSKSFINVSDEYPMAAYCNARVCYTHYKKNMDGTSGDTVSTSETFDPYYVLEADRMQSGICFYILYFLDCLFDALGMNYDNSDLLTVGDMKRLCFFTTHCKYDMERKYPENSNYDFQELSSINNWLSSRNTKANLSTAYEQTKKLESITVNGQTYSIGDELPNGLGKLKEASFKVEDQYGDTYTGAAPRVTFSGYDADKDKVVNDEYLSKQQVADMLGAMKATFNINTKNGILNCATKCEPITMKIKLSERISARTSNVGDTFTAKTVEDVTIGGVCYPAGSTVKGVVSSVSRRGVKNPGYVAFEFKKIKNGDNCA